MDFLPLRWPSFDCRFSEPTMGLMENMTHVRHAISHPRCPANFSSTCVNFTWVCCNDDAGCSPPVHEESKFRYTLIVICSVYVLGVLGNLTALFILCRVRSRPHNAKHRMMLRCLVSNDLVALIGMMSLFLIQCMVKHSLWLCRFRVVLRGFGLYSGCVVIVMAVERYIALTMPFFYQKHVTIQLLKRSIFGMWLVCLTLVCLPLVPNIHFGLYAEQDNCTGQYICARYKMAKETPDVTYAYLYFTFGMILVFCIVWCNLAVMKSLCLKGPPGSRQHVLVRRISRNSSLSSNSSTKEEVAFGKLMVLLCVVFVLCWLPQMISIPLAHLFHNWKNLSHFFKFADLLMAFHFTLDPYLYVLQRWSVVRSLFRASSSRTSSTKTSYLEACPLK
ncbi:unnamed protein product [Bemisia tabaci]|uniref:G-protein coupled receptors family 1 profile domain-containing protein n=1 Tax=Bemisia tabaci TaxID=7038 RepID=A0A9P0F7G2_BEMTA|nr:unnamed protein product [Bemisia tabaci]